MLTGIIYYWVYDYRYYRYSPLILLSLDSIVLLLYYYCTFIGILLWLSYLCLSPICLSLFMFICILLILLLYYYYTIIVLVLLTFQSLILYSSLLVLLLPLLLLSLSRLLFDPLLSYLYVFLTICFPYYCTIIIVLSLSLDSILSLSLLSYLWFYITLISIIVPMPLLSYLWFNITIIIGIRSYPFCISNKPTPMLFIMLW